MRFRILPKITIEQGAEFSRVSYWLKLFLTSLVVFILALAATLPFSPLDMEAKAQLFVFDLLSVTFALFLFWMVHRGLVRLAAMLFLTVIFVGIIAPTIFVFGTIAAPNALGFFMLIPLTGLLLGRREMIVIVILSVISVLAIYGLEVAGMLMPESGQVAAPETFLAILLGIGVNTALLISTLRDTERSAEQAQDTAAELAHRNRELSVSQAQLEAARDELEIRVAQRTVQLDSANRQLRAEMDQRMQSELRFRRLAERSPDFISILDLSTQSFNYTSRTELFGHTVFGVTLQHDFREWVHDEDRDVLQALWRRFSTGTEQSESIEFRLRGADGQWHWVQSRDAVLEQDTAGQALSALVTLSDITSIKAREEDLRVAKNQAEAAARAKSEFLADMSHEIRTPMNGVIGITELLLSTTLTDEQRDFVETLRHSSHALMAIISDILDFSKIELGSLQLDFQPCDVARCIEEALDVVSADAAVKGLELMYFLNPSVPPTVMTDMHRLRQILVNLLANAVKFTDEGEVFVSIDAHPVGADSLELYVRVRDTGIGIAQESMGLLFQSFSQVDSSYTRRHGGTGLGLAISRHLCERMGGALWADSTPGVGSTFHFTIRVGVAQVPSRQSSDEESAGTRLAGTNLWVVDGNRTSRELIVALGTSWRMSAVGESTGSAVIGGIERNVAIDALVVSLPLDDGAIMDWVAQVRRLRPNLPLIFYVPITNVPLRMQLVGVPTSVPLFKPVKPHDLRSALLKLLNEIQASTVAAAPPIFDATFADHHPYSILVVEDNVVNQKVLLRMLDRLGYHADLATNGQEAVDALQNRTYDVIFMDVQMPVMDGLEATRQIRTMGDTLAKRPYIIAMTAAATEADHDLCIQSGMDDFVTKPAKVEMLVQSLERGTTAPSLPA